MQCWRRRGNRFKAKYTVPTAAKSEGVMVWAAMDATGKVIVRRCPKKVNAAAYQIPSPNVPIPVPVPVPVLHTYCYDYYYYPHTTYPTQEILSGSLKFIKSKSKSKSIQFQVQQDGASPHTAKSTKKWLGKKKVRLFNGGKWPAHSPDLNPIEHLWPVVTRQLIGCCFSSKDSPWAELQVQFDAIPKETVRNLYGSMARHMAAVLVAKGAHTKY